LDAANRGSYLDAGTLLCLVGDPRRLQAVALIDQADLEFVQPGQRVVLRLNQMSSRTLGGTVQEVARIDLEAEPRQLAAVGGLPARIDTYGVARPLTTAYQARISLDQPGEAFLSGAPGQARITVSPRSLGQRLVRYLRGTFRFNL
jgi:putative peptide zinc metalloprotease protein